MAKVAKIAKGVGLATLLFTHDALGALYLVGHWCRSSCATRELASRHPQRVGRVEK